MRRGHRLTALAVAALMMSGCYGPFLLTKKLHQWNGQVGDKWAQEIVFLVFAWLPVYGLATLGDAIVFNSIEFWTGNNPMDETADADATPATRRLVRGNAEVIMTRTAGAQGPELTIEQFRSGEPAGTLHMVRDGDMTVGLDADGQVLFRAQAQPDGSVVISDASGRTVQTYPAAQVERLVSLTTR
ncbi:MAG TPA: DUF3332 domain-containing protein [bacterium]